MTEQYVPYGTLARAEAVEIANPISVPSCLRDLNSEQFDAVQVLVAHAYLVGMDMAALLIGRELKSMPEIVQAYLAGYVDGENK